MNRCQFNTVVIINAIPVGELNTARRLREDIESVAGSLDNGPKVRYFTTENLSELELTLTGVRHDASTSSSLPLIHFEGHGTADGRGLALPSGECCTWEALRDMLIPINVATELNLMLIMATCHGGSFARASRTIDRAPLWGLIGPRHEIKAGQVEDNFRTFYQTLFQTGSGSAAIKALTQVPGGEIYYLTSAERFFYEVWAGYKREFCTPAAIDERARNMRKLLREQGLSKIPSLGNIKRRIPKQEQESFAKFTKTFFMHDLFPLNIDRFDVTLRKAEQIAEHWMPRN